MRENETEKERESERGRQREKVREIERQREKGSERYGERERERERERWRYRPDTKSANQLSRQTGHNNIPSRLRLFVARHTNPWLGADSLPALPREPDCPSSLPPSLSPSLPPTYYAMPCHPIAYCFPSRCISRAVAVVHNKTHSSRCCSYNLNN